MSAVWHGYTRVHCVGLGGNVRPLDHIELAGTLRWGAVAAQRAVRRTRAGVTALEASKPHLSPGWLVDTNVTRGEKMLTRRTRRPHLRLDNSAKIDGNLDDMWEEVRSRVTEFSGREEPRATLADVAKDGRVSSTSCGRRSRKKVRLYAKVSCDRRIGGQGEDYQ